MNTHTNLHAHVSSTVTDCDGRFDNDYVATMTQDERDDQFGDMDFERRIIGNMVSLSTPSGTLTVTSGVEYGRKWSRAEWVEQTEEGYRHVEALFCTDECDTEATSQRDHFAEAMGY